MLAPAPLELLNTALLQTYAGMSSLWCDSWHSGGQWQVLTRRTRNGTGVLGAGEGSMGGGSVGGIEESVALLGTLHELLVGTHSLASTEKC